MEGSLASAKNGIYYFAKLNGALSCCKEIDEFDIIPSIKPETKSSPLVLHETKLGIFSWCVKDLFCHAYAELANARKHLKSETTEAEDVSIMDLSQVILLLHSEDYTIWNLRKCCIAKQVDKYARAELKLSALVLRKHPRSAEAFSHRRWLINLLQERKCQILETKQFIQDELDLALLCAEKYPDNYVTWNQRCWLVDYFMFDKALWLEKELTSMQDWLWTHVSDHCVYHFRQYLLGKLTVICTLEKINELLLEEFKLTNEILKHYPVFETVWYHRRFLISLWSTKFGTCYTCLNLCKNRTDIFSIQSNITNLKGKYDNKVIYCQDCETLGEAERISITNEIECCRRLIIGFDDGSEKTRTVGLVKSHLIWLHFCAQKLLKKR